MNEMTYNPIEQMAEEMAIEKVTDKMRDIYGPQMQQSEDAWAARKLNDMLDSGISPAHVMAIIGTFTQLRNFATELLDTQDGLSPLSVAEASSMLSDVMKLTADFSSKMRKDIKKEMEAMGFAKPEDKKKTKGTQ